MRGTQGLNPKLNLSVLEDVLRAPVEAGDPRKCCFDFSTSSFCKKDVETMILVNLRGGALQGVPIEGWRAILCVFHSGFVTGARRALSAAVCLALWFLGHVVVAAIGFYKHLIDKT